MPQVTVIIPVFNTEQYLDKCLNSVLGGTFKDIEVLIINDGSPDGEVCNVYPAIDNRVRVIHFKHNQGLSAARNEGLRQAAAPFISFVDSDDWIHPDKYAEMLRISTKYDASMVSCGFQEHAVNGRPPSTQSIKPQAATLMSGEEALKRMLLADQSVAHTACGKLYKRELFNGVNYPEGRLYEDAATTYKLYYKANNVATTPARYYNYLIRRTGITGNGFTPSSMDKLKAASEITEFIERHCPKLTNHALCFSTITALRLAAGLSPKMAALYPAEYIEIETILKNSKPSPLLSTRHRCLLFLYKHCRFLYQALWDVRLRRLRHP